jgi:hypothetical protein
MVSLAPAELVLAKVLGAVLALAALYALRLRVRGGGRWQAWDGAGVLALVLLAVYLASPGNAAGGAFILPRLQLLLALALLLWIAARPLPRDLHLDLRWAGVVIAAAFLAAHWVKYVELDALAREYRSAARAVQPNTTLLPLSFADGGRAPNRRAVTNRVRPFRHLAGRIAAERKVVAFDNYEANAGFFPVIFRPEVNPYRFIGRQEDPRRHPVRFLDYERRTPGRIDQVLVWGVEARQRRHPNVVTVYEQLRARYRLVYRSPGRGLVEVWRRR